MYFFSKKKTVDVNDHFVYRFHVFLEIYGWRKAPKNDNAGAANDLRSDLLKKYVPSFGRTERTLTKTKTNDRIMPQTLDEGAAMEVDAGSGYIRRNPPKS